MSCGSVSRGLGGGCVHVLCCRLSGASAGVMERIRCCRWPFGCGSVPGWKSIFCHMAVWCGSRSAVVGAGGWRLLVLVALEWLHMRVWVDRAPWAGMVMSLGVP